MFRNIKNILRYTAYTRKHQKILIAILIFLCQACANKIDYGFECDPSKYSELPQGYGIVVFRPLPIKESEYDELYDAKMHTLHSLDTTWRRLDPKSGKFDKNYYYLSHRHIQEGEQLQNFVNTITLRRLWMRYGAQDFYTVYVLKPGIYLLTEASIYAARKQAVYITDFDNKPKFYFTVLPNQAIYIGDFLASENEHGRYNILWGSRTYTISFKVVDKFTEAKEYFAANFPQFLLELDKNLIRWSPRWSSSKNQRHFR